MAHSIPQGFHVPVAAFFDLPIRVQHRGAESCKVCGGEVGAGSLGSSCQRCFKRRARARVCERWASRFSESASGMLADLICPRRNSTALDEAFDAAIAANAEPEAFRAILIEFGYADFVEARDERQRGQKPRGNFGPSVNRRPRGLEVYENAPPLRVIISEVRELMSSTRFAGGMWLNSHATWSDRDNHELRVLCAAKVKIGEAADILGRRPSAIAWRAVETGLTLPDDWRPLVRGPRRATERSALLAYPFIAKRREEHADLIAVNSIVPYGFPGREDVCQEIMLAIWEGTMTIEQLRRGSGDLRAFLKSFKKKNYEAGGYGISLDEPLYDDDGPSMLERISADPNRVWA